jgi:hypothetical protein
MIRHLRRIVTILICVLCIISVTAQVASTEQNNTNDIPEGWKFFPRIGISVEYGGYIVQQDNFSSLLRRHLTMDLLQYRRHIFYLEFNERFFLGIPGNKWNFNLMKYDIAMLGYRYDFGDFYVGLLLHHQCNNIVRSKNYDKDIDRERSNTYDLGVEFLTKNMRTGMKDRGINFDSPDNFEFLGHLGGRFWVAKVLSSERINLSWLIESKVRYDIFRYKRLVPYVEATGKLMTGPVTRLAPSVELGTRYHLATMDITPFLEWSRNQEALIISNNPLQTSFIAKNSLLAGLRLETLLDADTFKVREGNGLQFFPETHGQAGYALFLNNRNFNGNGFLQVDFEALRWHPWTIFFYTGMNYITANQDFRPEKVTFWIQYGLTYAWNRYFVEGFMVNNWKLDSDVYRGTSEQANLGGVRAGTRGMKPGHYNDGISFQGPESFQWLNNWNVQGSAGHYFQNRDWQYLWDLAAQVRWDVLRWRRMVPYCQAEINWMAGGGQTKNAVEYAFEPGLRFHGVLDLAVYYRFQHRDNILFFGGPAENENLIGLKTLF